MTYDLVVLGAGLAGLSAARDLVARWSRRPGPRGPQSSRRSRRTGRRSTTAESCSSAARSIGNSHTAYQELVAELGLTLIPSYVAEPGELTYVLHEGAFVGDTPTWFSDADHRSMAQVEQEFAALAATVDPDDPWSHPDAVALDDMSVTRLARGPSAPTRNVRTRAGGRSAGTVLGLVRAHVAARAAAQVRQHLEQGPVLLRRVGEPARRRGIGDRGAAHGRRTRRPHPAGRAGARGQGRARRLHGPVGVRGDRRGGRGCQRAARRAAA